MTDQTVYTLLDPQNNNLAFKVFNFEDNSYFDHLQRNNYYSLIWIRRGSGTAFADCTQYEFEPGTLFAFTPYQPFLFRSEQIAGTAIHFHPDFFCIHKHHAEVACHGILFNNIYHPPYVTITEPAATTIDLILGQIRNEMQHQAMAQFDLLVSYLKIILITASRLKSEQVPNALQSVTVNKEPFILQNLKQAIEQNFKTKHAPADYAETLNISPKALARITKTYFNKTLTDLIAERIVIEAKRELYLTNKSVKEIAWELGYQDEYYFSRFFKTNADVSPQTYRDTVGYARAIN